MRTPSRPPSAAVLLAALATAALPERASGAPAAVPPLPFAAADAANTLDLTTLPDGRVALAWTHAVSRNGAGFALRPAGGLFTDGVVQDVTGESTSVLGVAPPGGGATYRLVRTGASGGTVTHALQGTLLDGGVPRNVALIGSTAFEPCPDGSTSIVAETTPSAGSQTLRIDRSSAAGIPASIQNFTGPHDSGDDAGELFPRLALSCEAGRLLLGFDRDTDTGAGETETLTVRAFTGATTTSTELIRITAAAGVGHGQIRLAEQPDGRVWVAYETGPDSGPGPYGVSLATHAPGNPLITTPSTSIPGADLRDVTVDGDGRLVVLYDAHPPGSTDNDDPGIPTVATVATGSTGVATTALATTADDRSRFFLTGHPDGHPRLVTQFSDGAAPPSDDSVTVAGMPGVPGQSGDAPLVVRAGGGGFFRGTYLPGGDLVAAWQDGGLPNGQIVEGGIDAGAPPTLGTVQAPGAVLAGENVTLESAPSDPMGLADSGWVVDGATLPGARVQTTFATAGTRVVTAFAVDRAGNRTETTRTVRVLPADAVAPTLATPPADTPTPPADRRAPRITTLSQTPSHLSRRATVLRVKVRADETSAVDLELRGRLRRGRDRGLLVLSTTRIGRLARGSTRTVRLRVRAGLVRLVEGGRLEVRAVATDLAGNRGTRTLRVRRR